MIHAYATIHRADMTRACRDHRARASALYRKGFRVDQVAEMIADELDERDVLRLHVDVILVDSDGNSRQTATASRAHPIRQALARWSAGLDRAPAPADPLRRP